MSKRSKILGAILALKRFTAMDLHEFSGVSMDTIRTVLRRDKEFLEDLGTETRLGGRGGRYKLYKLRSDKNGTELSAEHL